MNTLSKVAGFKISTLKISSIPKYQEPIHREGTDPIYFSLKITQNKSDEMKVFYSLKIKIMKKESIKDTRRWNGPSCLELVGLILTKWPFKQK